MSGHSKWATTKRQKAAVDAKKGAIFTKLSNLITIAVKEKGGDPETNFSLRMAIDKARQFNVPKDNIDRAIKKGLGEGGAAQIEELTYEGFGPANSQFVISALTDSKNRSASEMRHLFSKYGGSLGSVIWNFTKKGVIRIGADELKNKKINIEELELELIDEGAEDIISEEEGVTIYTKIENLQGLKRFLDKKEIKTDSAEIEYVAKEYIKIENPEEKEKIEKFTNALEDCEEIANFYTNVNL